MYGAAKAIDASATGAAATGGAAPAAAVTMQSQRTVTAEALAAVLKRSSGRRYMSVVSRCTSLQLRRSSSEAAQ